MKSSTSEDFGPWRGAVVARRPRKADALTLRCRWWPSRAEWRMKRQALRRDVPRSRGLRRVSFRTWNVSTAFAAGCPRNAATRVPVAGFLSRNAASSQGNAAAFPSDRWTSRLSVSRQWARASNHSLVSLRSPQLGSESREDAPARSQNIADTKSNAANWRDNAAMIRLIAAKAAHLAASSRSPCGISCKAMKQQRGNAASWVRSDILPAAVSVIRVLSCLHRGAFTATSEDIAATRPTNAATSPGRLPSQGHVAAI